MASDRVVLPTALLPSHYFLELTPDLEQFTFTCSEEITCAVSEETNKLTLHAREITVNEVSFVPAGGAAVEVLETSYAHKAHTVTFTFASALPLGEGVLKVSFNGILNGDMAGFYRSSYSDATGAKKIMASTQFEALDARRAFLCWDEPAVKATFTVALIVPAHLTALSNMPEKAVTHVTGKQKVVHKRVLFETSPKMSTYLLAWAVGEFDHVAAVTKGGVAIRVFSPPGRGSQGAFALDVAVRALDFFDSYFALPYPLPKCDMLCVTEFAMGAMENWGLVTYRENALMIGPEASSQSKQRVAIVVVHELAHQWFGNLVTMAWWDGLWLNEGFAAYMEHFATDTLEPSYKIWEQYTTDALASALRLDALRSSHPVIVPIKHAEEVEQVFDAISYCKGSTVVRMVAALLGPEKFRDGLRAYMRRHAYGCATTPDLWGAWSEASGLDINGLMATWTLQTGYPILKVLEEAVSAQEVKITLEQSRFFSDGFVPEADSEDAKTLWSIPLVFATSSGVCGPVIMDKRVQTFSVPVSAGSSWIKINTSSTALVRVAHTANMLSRLREAIAKGEVSAVDRAGLVLDAYALAKAGQAPLEDVVDLLKALTNETSSITWSAIAGVLSGLHLLFTNTSSSAAEAFNAFAKDMVVRALKFCGWDPKEGEGHTDKLLRATVLGLLDTFAWEDEEVQKEARRRFEAHWENPKALPAEYKTTVYRLVLMKGTVKDYDAILAAFHATDDNQERKHAYHSLGSAAETALKIRTLDWAVKSGEVKLQDFFYPIGSVACSLEGAQLAWKYYQDNFAVIKEMLAKAAPSLMDAVIVNCIGRFCTEEAANEVEAFFTANPLPQSSRRIAQSLENMRANAKMLKALEQSQLATIKYWA